MTQRRLADVAGDLATMRAGNNATLPPLSHLYLSGYTTSELRAGTNTTAAECLRTVP